MKISVAGTDRTAELAPRLQQLLSRLDKSRQPTSHPRALSALSLKDKTSEQDQLPALLELIRMNHAADTRPFACPRKPGAFGRLLGRLRELLWKLLRYQHDRIAFQQNTINLLMVQALGAETRQRLKQHDAMLQRLEKLESALNRAEKNSGTAG